MNLTEMRSKINRLQVTRDLKKNDLQTKKDLQLILEKDNLDLIKARELIIAAASMTQENVKFHLTSIVDLALNTVLDNPPKFIADIVTRRNQTEVDLLIESDGIVQSPLDAIGGGAIDLISFSLRLSLWMLKQTRKVFILDEPFRNVSHSYQSKVGELLKMLSDKMGIQFILISHQKNVDQYADKIFNVTKNKWSEVV
jgi:DNA repair exonuclease SbcCD ATPase subunit